jgi:colanic acid/amylovoran biosynthesis protein
MGRASALDSRRPGAIRRVTILNTYSWHNKGDSAIVLGTAQALRQINPDVRITIVSQTPAVDREPYAQRGIGVVGGPFGLVYRRDMTRARRLAGFALGFPALLAGIVIARLAGPWTIAWWPGETGRLARDLVSSDLVVSCGGGFWHDSDGGLGIRFHLLQVICALLGGAPVVCLGQSIGPFRSRVRRRIVGSILSRVAAVVLRESESLPTALAMGIDAKKITVTGDMAFALAPAHVRQAVTPPGPANARRIRIGVTARAWWFPGSRRPQQEQARYEQALVEALDHLIEQRDAEVVFLPQVTGPYEDDDRVVQRRIASRLCRPERATVLEKELSPEALIRFIGELDFVIATRFHSAILTMLANVPVIAIAYEHKTTGIMGQMGLGHWVTTIETVTAQKLITLSNQLAVDYESVKTQLARAVEGARQRALESAIVCARAAEQYRKGERYAGEVVCSAGDG